MKFNFQKIPQTIWALGIVTLLMNTSSVVIFSLMPKYLTQVLGISMLSLGFLEGFVEATAWLTRIFSGVISDYFQKRKPLLVLAYGLMAVSRLIVPLFPFYGGLVSSRFIDRIGNGLQATPREALVGDTAPKALKGTCYGLRQTLGTTGSFMGAAGLMLLFSHYGEVYEVAFWFAIIPAFMATLTTAFFVKDYKKKDHTSQTTKQKAFSLSELKNLNYNYWSVVALSAVFMLANYSGSFMILQVSKAGLSDQHLPFVMVLQNLFTLSSALPIGWLSDRLNRQMFLALGFVITILANLFLGLGSSIPIVMLGVALWGTQMGINQSLLVTKIADTCPQKLRGTGFGIYYLVNAVALLCTNTLAGWLSDSHGLTYVFYSSSAFAALALMMLSFLRSKAD